MKKDTQMPCVVFSRRFHAWLFSHRLHRFHRCCAMNAYKGIGVGAGSHGNITH